MVYRAEAQRAEAGSWWVGLLVVVRYLLPPHLYKSGGRWRRDNAIEEIKRLDMLLEYAVPHGEEAEAERIREELKRLTDSI